MNSSFHLTFLLIIKLYIYLQREKFMQSHLDKLLAEVPLYNVQYNL